MSALKRAYETATGGARSSALLCLHPACVITDAWGSLFCCLRPRSLPVQKRLRACSPPPHRSCPIPPPTKAVSMGNTPPTAAPAAHATPERSTRVRQASDLRMGQMISLKHCSSVSGVANSPLFTHYAIFLGNDWTEHGINGGPAVVHYCTFLEGAGVSVDGGPPATYEPDHSLWGGCAQRIAGGLDTPGCSPDTDQRLSRVVSRLDWSIHAYYLPARSCLAKRPERSVSRLSNRRPRPRASVSTVGVPWGKVAGRCDCLVRPGDIFAEGGRGPRPQQAGKEQVLGSDE